MIDPKGHVGSDWDPICLDDMIMRESSVVLTSSSLFISGSKSKAKNLERSPILCVSLVRWVIVSHII